MLGQVGAQRIERVRSRGRFEAAHETGLLRGDEAKGILWIGPVVHGPFEAWCTSEKPAAASRVRTLSGSLRENGLGASVGGAGNSRPAARAVNKEDKC